MSRPKPSGRSYGRLTRHERNTVERMLDLNRSAREIAAELGRSPSTVTREVAAHRYVTAPRSRYGEPAPADLSGACPRLSAWPRCCNGCSHRRGWRSMRRRHGDAGLHSLSTCGNDATARRRGLFPRCASCGNAGPVQAVALRLKINLKKLLPKISSETFNSRVPCSPAVLYWSW